MDSFSKNFKKPISYVLSFVLLISTSAYAGFLSDLFNKKSEIIIDAEGDEIITESAAIDEFKATPVGEFLDLSKLNIEYPKKVDVDASLLSDLSTDPVATGFGFSKNEYNIPINVLRYEEKYGSLGGIYIADTSLQNKKVYFTFDCGYEGGYTWQMLDTLKEKNVRAVFFITGHYARDTEYIVKRMIEDGHIVGNHTWSHIDCARSSLKDVQSNVFKAHDFVKNKYNYEMKLFRYPYGNFSEQTLKFLDMQGYKQVFWTFGYKDWDTENQPEEGAAKVEIITSACPGMIYLLHAESKTNASVLAECIDEIRTNGFTIGDPIDLLVD